MFENPEVPVESLPQAESLDWRRLHPSYAREQQLVRGLLVAAVTVAWLVLIAVRDIPAPLLAVLVVALLVGGGFVAWPSIAVPRCGFVMRDHDIVYRHGVLFRKVTAVPYNRVQHVEVSSDPLDRRFGIGTLKLFTAGGSGGDLAVEGLPLETAEQLRDFILGRAGAAIERD